MEPQILFDGSAEFDGGEVKQSLHFLFEAQIQAMEV